MISRQYLHTASYGGVVGNFLVSINSADNIDNHVNSKYDGILSVALNILQRGSSVPMSEPLRKKIGTDKGARIALKCKKRTWSNIKGGGSNNDALFFFDTLIAKYAGKYAFIRELILPEAKFRYIIKKHQPFWGQSVDFWLPQAKAVIEIDGEQHNDYFQKQKDVMRDSALKAEGIRVFRFKASDVRFETEIFRAQFAEFIKYISVFSDVNMYLNAVSRDGVKANSPQMYKDAIMRIQIALLDAMKQGIFDLSRESIRVDLDSCDFSNAWGIFSAAYEDLGLWLRYLSTLADVELSLPEIKFGLPGIQLSKDNLSADIKFDINMFSRYTDEDFNRPETNLVVVRTAYNDSADYFVMSCSERINYVFSGDRNKLADKALKSILKNLFGFDDFREGQLPIIKHYLSGHDVIGILPTGTGKSLCYQMSCLLQPGISIVVVPIISLMQDQQKGMVANHIERVAYISAALSGIEKEQTMENFGNGRYQLMLISPERTQNEKFVNTLRKINEKISVSNIILDEVHCLSQWGHDFRIAYLRLVPVLRENCPSAKFMGLTATASQVVLDDLKAEMAVNSEDVKALASMDRSELEFKKIIVSSNNERNEVLKEIVEKGKQQYLSKGKSRHSVSLVFCQTVKGRAGTPSCINISTVLQDSSLQGNLLSYNGKLTAVQRKDIQNMFMEESFSGAMVCTCAFGMGIDKPNIKTTVHASMPKSLESFYQEAGRAGRDADKSTKSVCYIIYMPEPDSVTKQDFDKIFDINTSVDERKRLCSSKLRNDLSSVLFLWNSGKRSIEDECNDIVSIIRILESGVYDIPFNKDFKLSERQESLYKLNILGVVSGWMVNYYGVGDVDKGESSSGVLHVDYRGVNLKNIKEHFIAYVRKYDMDFTLGNKVERYKVYREAYAKYGNSLEFYIYCLILWINNNIIYNQLQSIYNMLQLCSPEVSDEEFRQRLNDYFKYTDENIVFDNIISTPNDYHKWFSLLYDGNGKLIPDDKVMERVTIASRYLESYAQNIALDFVYSVLLVMANRFKGSWGERRLSDSLRDIDEIIGVSGREYVIKELVNIASYSDEDTKNCVASIILRHHKSYIRMVYDRLHDYVSAAMLIEAGTDKVRKIVRRLDDGLC